ncbi:substrate-binding domain-containing protein [Deinococcus aluminii]|uniref:substrate-binding domain-containing protein n=1 Tax=Deinococcus aluminii TaxID=1656885 RepID=UPI0031EB772F
MSSPESPLRVHLRAYRERAHLSRAELGSRAGLSRQAIHQIETGATVPSTRIALHLARVLGVRVEDLFALPDPPLTAWWRGAGPARPGVRVRLAQVGRGWLALPLQGEAGLQTAADGLTTHADGGLVQVTPLGEGADLERTAVVCGCDPALGLLAATLGREDHGGRVLWQPASSLDALRTLARGEAHAAGLHLYDSLSGESNAPAVRRELGGRDVHLLTLWDWEQGLIVAPGNPLGVRGPADLASGRVRLVNRDVGAGSRVLLDTWLDRAGVKAERRLHLPGYTSVVGSHLDAARAVAQGQADAAPGPEFAARALGLDFVPLQRERYDLAVPAEYVTHPGVQALLQAARSPAFQTEQRALGGYTITHPGDLWQVVA